MNAKGDLAIALLSDSVTALEATSGRLELARSLAELGRALRRGGQRSAARQVLRRALDLSRRDLAAALSPDRGN